MYTDLGTPISNFAVSKFDNPAVLENNLEVRAIPQPTRDQTMSCTRAARINRYCGLHRGGQELRQPVAGSCRVRASTSARRLCRRREERQPRGLAKSLSCTPAYQKRRQVGKAFAGSSTSFGEPMARCTSLSAVAMTASIPHLSLAIVASCSSTLRYPLVYISCE